MIEAHLLMIVLLIYPIAQLDNNSYITNFELLQKNTSNDKPLLNCGARVVIETESDVRIVR